MPDIHNRCPWAEASESERDYHDREWGVPVWEDQRLFEMLTLEGAQAGLSWSTVLAKRDGYRRVFAQFDAACVARYTPQKIDRLLDDASIIRHRGKIEATVNNAKALLTLQASGETLAGLLWSFVGNEPLDNCRQEQAAIPAHTNTSRRMSRELKRRGFRFIGPTTCYALMQAAGLVNDHLVSCYRYPVVARIAKA